MTRQYCIWFVVTGRFTDLFSVQNVYCSVAKTVRDRGTYGCAVLRAYTSTLIRTWSQNITPLLAEVS